MTEVPEKVKKIVKKKAEEEWPDDYVMQLDVLETQTNAYLSIAAMVKKNSGNKVFKTILKKAMAEYDDDYEMQLYTIKEQLEAAIKLSEFHGSEKKASIMEGVSATDSDDWTDDDMQMLLYRIDSFR